MALYLPNNLPYSSCVVVRDNYTARVYEEEPTMDSIGNFIDVALDNHYIYSYGVEYFDSENPIPACLSSSEISSSWIDRTDVADICIVILFVLIILWFTLSKPIKWLFRGWF